MNDRTPSKEGTGPDDYYLHGEQVPTVEPPATEAGLGVEAAAPAAPVPAKNAATTSTVDNYLVHGDVVPPVV